MEYQRFLELVERFFAKAGTVLRKKGRDYPAIDDTPSYILLDKGRNTYYMMEIASGPTVPAADEELRRAIEAHAAESGTAPYISGLFISLGAWLKVNAMEGIEETLRLEGLQQQSCLVVAHDLMSEIEAYMKQIKLQYQTVPLKGILGVYFFTKESSASLIKIYESLEMDERTRLQSIADLTGLFKEKTAEEKRDEEPYLKNVHILEDAPPPSFFPVKVKKTKKAEEEQIKQKIEDDEREKEQEKEQEAESPGERISFLEKYKKHKEETEQKNGNEEEAFGTEELREIARIKESIEKEEEYKRSQRKKAGSGEIEASFYKLMRNIWSFVVYAPLAIINLFMKGRMPASAMCWISCVVVLIGLYYFILPIILYPITEKILNVVRINMEYILIFFSGWDTSDVFTRFSTTPGMEGFLGTVANFSLSVLYFDINLVRFLNSSYYLRYMLAFGYLIAIVPVWRNFGLKIVAFLIYFYLIYLPLLLISSIAVKVLSIHATTAISLSQADTTAALTTLNSAFIASALLAVAVPLLSSIFALKALRWKSDII